MFCRMKVDAGFCWFSVLSAAGSGIFNGNGLRVVNGDLVIRWL